MQNQEGDDGLEVGLHQHVYFNTGVYFVKSSVGGTRFMNAWVKMRELMMHDNDQIGTGRGGRGGARGGGPQADDARQQPDRYVPGGGGQIEWFPGS